MNELVAPVEGFRYAGFGRRAVAFLLDALIEAGLQFVLALIVSAGVTYVVARWVPGTDSLQVASRAQFIAGPVLGLTLTILNHVVLLSLTGASVGKLIVGIRVVRSDGSRVGVLRALGRMLAKILSAFTLGIGYLMQLWTRRRQALHDLLADTIVVRPRP